MKHARIANNTAVDVRSESPEGFFTPEIATQFVEVPDEVENGWLLENGIWSAPPAPPAPAPEPVPQVTYPKVGPIAFKLLFTAPERIKAKLLRATDEFIEDFWGLLDDPRTTEVDLGLASVQLAVEYTLATVKAAGVDLDVAARKSEILSGDVQ